MSTASNSSARVCSASAIEYAVRIMMESSPGRGAHGRRVDCPFESRIEDVLGDHSPRRPETIGRSMIYGPSRASILLGWCSCSATTSTDRPVTPRACRVHEPEPRADLESENRSARLLFARGTDPALELARERSG